MNVYSLRAVVAPLALALCALASAYCAEGQEFVLESPFDLTIGSTNYAVRLGRAVHSSASACYDPETKVTTTNWSAYASVKLAKPYHGVTDVSLQFKGEDRVLDSYSIDIGRDKRRMTCTLSVDEARKIMQEVSDDITKRLGMEFNCNRNLSDGEIDKLIEEHLKNPGRGRRNVSMSFMNRNALGEREGVGVGYGLAALVDKNRKCCVGIHVYTSQKPMFKVESKPMALTAIPGLVSEDEQKKAHEEAKELREALGKLFGIDFGSAKGDGGEVVKGLWEWTNMVNSVAGLDECRPNFGSAAVFQVPIVNYSARRAYPGDVEEAELERQAKAVLGCIESAYGKKIPVVDTKDGMAELAKVLGDGVPTFGDTRARLELDKMQTFVGKVGDLAVEISYALPRYEKDGADYRLVRRGTVLLCITQSPVITLGKTL